MRLMINVQLKNGVLDPQGKAVHNALLALKFNGIQDVRIGKQIILELDETDKEKARSRAIEMCEELLCNTVIEDYTIEFFEC